MCTAGLNWTSGLSESVKRFSMPAVATGFGSRVTGPFVLS
jgi:hypothetical protein